MGLHQVAFFVQIRHDVADGSRTEAVAAAPGDGARRYRLARGDVAFDDLMQNFQAARRHTSCKNVQNKAVAGRLSSRQHPNASTDSIAWNFSSERAKALPLLRR